MRERANKELALIAACLIGLCLLQSRAAEKAQAGAAPGAPAGFIELTADQSSYLIPLESGADAKQIDAGCPAQALHKWDRVAISKQECRVERGAASSFARLAAGDKIPVNLAGAKEFEVIPGVGAKRALQILELREGLGGFKSLDQLERLNWFSPEMKKETERFFTTD